ncbi:MAG: helix-turn-helix domain-containing protein [Terrimicrobiaceae bacterium]
MPNWLLIYNVGGSGIFRHADGQVVTRPGDAVLLPPHVRHDYGSERSSIPYVRLFAHFQPRPEWHDLLQWPEEVPGLRKLAIGHERIQQRVKQNFNKAIAHVVGHFRRREFFAMNAFEQVLLWCDAENPRAESARCDERIVRAMEFLTRNIFRPITLAMLAKHCGLSVSRLSALFRQSTGTTPQQFLEVQRLDRARHLLRITQNPIKEIAADVGYSDPFYFSLRFKRHTGVSPKRFRQDFSERFR